MNIGDLYFSLRGDDKQLIIDATKGGEAAGKAAGTKLQAGINAGMRLVGAAAGALLGIALKGGQELLAATAAYRTETGATAEEAEVAQKSIGRLYQTNTQGLAEIGATLAAVKVNLQLTGEEGEHAADKLLKFAKVTGQDGPAAVTALDDILDSFNLTAADSDAILDTLIAGHQKWGGSIAEDQANLAKMAPALNAANLSWKDGAALLGLFNAAGVDAAAAATGMTKALSKVKSPEELQKLIADISATEDPFERAQKAADLFGVKAGAKLAQALGSADLADFAIDADTAAGALDRAAEAANSGPYEQLTLVVRKLTGPLAELGTSLGPLVLGFAALGGPRMIVGVSTLLGGLASKLLLRPFAAVGTRIAALIGANILGSSAISNAIVGDLGSPKIKAGAGKVGTLLGTTLGKAAAVGFAAVMVLLVIDTWNRITNELAAQSAAIALDVGQLLKTGTDAQLETARLALKSGMDSLREQVLAKNVLALEPLKQTVAAYDAVQAELNRRADVSARVAWNALKNAKPAVAAAAGALADELPTALQKREALVRAAAEQWARKPIGEQLVLLGHDARIRGAEAALALAGGLRDRRSAVASAMDQLRTDMKNAMSPKRLAAKDIGLLFGKDLTKGLNSADPVVKAQAKATRALIEDELIETIKAGGAAGTKIQEELEKKLHSKDPAVKAQAERTKSVIDAALKAQPARTPGEVIGDQLNRDLKSKGTPLGKTAYDLGRTIARNLLAGVKGTGFVAPASGSGGGRRGGVQEYDMGTSYVPYDQLAYIHKGEIIHSPAESDRIRAGLASAGGPISNTYQTTLVMPDAANRDPFAVLDRASRMQRWGQLNPARTATGG